MNLINDTEIKKLQEWSSKKTKLSDSFDCTKKTNDTYFSEFDNTNNIHSYGFQTVPELTSLLDDLWNGIPDKKEIVQVCSVAALKRRPRHNIVDKKDTGDNLKIPDYIYVF